MFFSPFVCSFSYARVSSLDLGVFSPSLSHSSVSLSKFYYPLNQFQLIFCTFFFCTLFANCIIFTILSIFLSAKFGLSHGLIDFHRRMRNSIKLSGVLPFFLFLLLSSILFKYSSPQWRTYEQPLNFNHYWVFYYIQGHIFSFLKSYPSISCNLYLILICIWIRIIHTNLHIHDDMQNRVMMLFSTWTNLKWKRKEN